MQNPVNNSFNIKKINSLLETSILVLGTTKGRITYDKIIPNPTFNMAGILFLENIGAMMTIPNILDKINIYTSIEFITKYINSPNIIFPIIN
jgi:hypothetical protein